MIVNVQLLFFRFQRKLGLLFSESCKHIFLRCFATIELFGFYSLLILLIRWSAIPISNKHYGNARKVYFFNKSVFIDDVQAIDSASAEVCFYALDRRILKTIASRHIVQAVSDNNFSIANERIREERENLAQFYKKLSSCWLGSSLFQLDFFSGNVVYWAEQEFAGEVCRKGGRFLVLQKESIQAPELEKLLEEKRLTGTEAFKGSHVFTYSQKVLNQLRAHGLLLDDHKTSVVGCPRLDRFFKVNVPVTCMSRRLLVIYPSAISQLPILFNIVNRDDSGWEGYRARFFAWLVQYCKDNRDVEVIVRGKRTDKVEMDQVACRYGFNILPNLKTDYHDPLILVVSVCQVAVGFNSTALLECLAAGMTVIRPIWECASDPKNQGWLIDFHNVFEEPDCEEILNQLIEEGLTRQRPRPLSKSEENCLEYWLGNSAGDSCQRVLSAIQADDQ